MGTSFDFFDDVREADSRAQATRASFWRNRRVLSLTPRTDWGLWTGAGRASHRANPSRVQDDLPDSIRRHLSTERATIPLYWRAPSDPDRDDWRETRLYVLPEMPRDPLLTLARRLEVPALVRAERGEDAVVRLLSSEGEMLDELGRDREGMVDVPEMVESLLRASLTGDVGELESYAADTVSGGMASHMAANRHPVSREEMHERLRASED